MWNWISCYVTGHDYSVCCDEGRMFLRCLVCGRRSEGWVVHGHAHVADDAHGLAHSHPAATTQAHHA